MKKIALFLLFLPFFSQAQEVLTGLHFNKVQYQKYPKSIGTAKSNSDTVRYFRFPATSVPFVDDFSSDKFFHYKANEYNCPDTFSYKKFLVDGDFIDQFIGTKTQTTIITRTKNGVGEWVETSASQPSNTIQFFGLDNPTTVDSTSIYFPNINRIDSVFTINDTVKKSFYIDSVVFTNDQFTLCHCFPVGSPLWQDNDVYVNNHFPIMPPSIGVATFDGADSSGMPYNWSVIPEYFPYGQADKLTSSPIDLSTLSNADSVYLSFYYQPQGRGANVPEESDSLVLQFRINSPTETWQNKFYALGFALPQGSVTSNSERFRYVNIKVDSAFLYNKFQFRFLNYGTLTGTVDIWNIDYVRLDKNRSAADSVYSDAAFVYEYKSLLKKYQNIPYPHYVERKLTDPDMLSDTLYPFMHNSNNVLMNLTLQGSVTPEGGTSSIISANSANNLAPFTYCQIGKTCVSGGDLFNMFPTAYEYPTGPQDSASFNFGIDIALINNDFIETNNQIAVKQDFANYYAYDDGTAENGYGLNVLDGKIAMRYKIYKPDTLQAVAMYFDPQTINFFTENSPYQFTLQVWIGAEFPDVLIYEEDSLQAEYGNSNFYSNKNDFAYYFIDTNLLIDTGGYVFVGWKQQTTQVLGLGFDRNTNSNENMFFDIADGNGWYTSELPGSWMIRPCFGKPFEAPTAVNEISNTKQNFTIVPNPTEDSFSLFSAQFKAGKQYTVTLSDLSGRALVKHTNLQTISVGNLAAGIYCVSITDELGVKFTTQKLVVVH